MKVSEFNQTMAYLLRPQPRQTLAIGGGVVEGQNLGSREGFAKIKKLEQRFSNKPGKYFVRSVVGVRDIPLNILEELPGFVRTTTEGVVFDTKANAQNFIDSELLADVKKAAVSTGAKAESRKLKIRKPKLFNRIIKLAEEGETSVQKIGEDPTLVKLNNGKKICTRGGKNCRI